jgi:hypothetical protein
VSQRPLTLSREAGIGGREAEVEDHLQVAARRAEEGNSNAEKDGSDLMVMTKVGAW